MKKTVGEIGILNSDFISDQFFLQCIAGAGLGRFRENQKRRRVWASYYSILSALIYFYLTLQGRKNNIEIKEGLT
jgi:hypothetical protein